MSSEKIMMALQLIGESQKELSAKVEKIDSRVKNLEKITDIQAVQINELQESVNGLRNSAIRGEIASGKRTKDVAEQFGLSPSRVTQIAPRSNFKH